MQKAHYSRAETKIIESRSMKTFNGENFIKDLCRQPWANVYQSFGKKKSPWMTFELRRLLFKRDYLKKRAITSDDPGVWHQYKRLEILQITN